MDEKFKENMIKTVFSRLGAGFILMLLAASTLTYSALSVVEFFAPGSTYSINVTLSVSLLTLYVLGAITYWCLKWYVPGGYSGQGECSRPVKLGLKGFLKLALISLGLGFVLNLTTIGMNFAKNSLENLGEYIEFTRHYIEYGHHIAPEPPSFIETDPLMEILGGINPLISILFIVIFTSIFEEYLFRKLLYDKLIVFGGKVFIIVSSLMFALFHINHHQLLYTFGIGLVFAGVMYFTKKIIYCILLHMFFNFFGTLPLHMERFSEMAMSAYLSLHLILAIIGIVFLVNWLRTYGLRVKFELPEIRIENVKSIILNPGMITFVILSVGAMVLQGAL